MKTPVLSAPITAFLLFSNQVSYAELPNGIASGDVTQTSVVVWTRSDTTGPLTFEYSLDAEFNAIVQTTQVAVTEPMLPVKALFNKLIPATQYYYRATDNSGTTHSGRFRTLADAEQNSALHFGVSGDWRGELSPFTALANVAEKQLDFFAVLGDTIYADYPSPDLQIEQATSLQEFRIKQNEVYSAHHGLNPLADLRASTSIFVTIDDHEVTNDFSGAADVSSDERFAADAPGTMINDSQLYENGIQSFLEYNPLAFETYADTGQDARMDGEVKLYRERIMGQTALLISLDTRTFRDQGLPAVENPLDIQEVSNYLLTSLTAPRTMLGSRQLDDLKNGLLQAQQNGIVWKFIAVPEPAQNLGIVGASDRFEGYAYERNEILQFISDNKIENVVFITADIHGTVVNNLTYQQLTDNGIVQIPTDVFEISTGSVAFDKPFGPTVLELAAETPADDLGNSLLDAFLAELELPSVEVFESLPMLQKDLAIRGIIDQQIVPLGYSAVGLEDSRQDATLIKGGYTALHTYGWTEFYIDPDNHDLLISTWGVPPYNEQDLNTDAAHVTAREPELISQFKVRAAKNAFQQCADFNGSLLSISCIHVNGETYSAKLTVKQSNPLQLALASAELSLTLDAPENCAVFQEQTGTIDLPCVNATGKQYSASLSVLSQSDWSVALLNASVLNK